MNASTKPQHASDDLPDFLIKTAFGCTLVVLLILILFSVDNFIQHRFMLGLTTLLTAIICVVNAWVGFHGKYNLLVNTWLFAPAGTITIVLAMYRLGAAGSYWPFLLLVGYYFVLPEKRAWLFNALVVAIFIPLAWFVLEPPLALRFSAVMLAISLFAIISMREINILHNLLKEQAVTDSLTGLLNRALLHDSLQQAIAQHKRSEIPMALIGFDVDHFKPINDTLGHAMGDLLLKQLGDLLKRRMRASDKVFRTGGEEFLVIAYNTNEQHCTEIAEDLRREVEQAKLLPDYKVTISVGVSGLQEGMDAAAWEKACDEKMYRAKEGGRNRVVA